MIEPMKTARPTKPNSAAPEGPLSVWLDPQSLADMLGLPIEVLANWRQTDVGPPYIKLTATAKGHVRYRRDRILKWQESCLRGVPENWQPIGAFLGEGAPSETGKVEWLPPGRDAIAIKIPIRTMTAWRSRTIGVPFIWIGGGGQHQVMYDRRDLEAFISRRQADPSVVPVIAKNVYRSDPRTKEERARMSAEAWKQIGHSDEEIRRRLGRRVANLVWPEAPKTRA